MVEKEAKPVVVKVVKAATPVLPVAKEAEPAPIPTQIVNPQPEITVDVAHTDMGPAPDPETVEIKVKKLQLLQLKAQWFDLQQRYNCNAVENQQLAQQIEQIRGAVAKMQGAK